MLSPVQACMLCFLLALLSPTVSLCAAAGNAAPLSGGFSLPIVSSHPEILHAAEAAPGDAYYNLTYIRPKLAHVDFPSFSVVVGVGSGQRRHFYKLALNFMGSLIWMQCRPSNPAVPQEGPIYDAAASRFFKYVLPTDLDCLPPYTHGHNKCNFAVKFQATTANGYLATDEFAFASSSGGNQVNNVHDLVFGCSHTTHGFQNHRVIAGVMGLNRHPLSFIGQLSRRGLANYRFSYCLVSQTQARAGRHGYLRFGIDIPSTSRAQSTPLLYGTTTQLYYVDLIGISLGGRRLTRISSGMFYRDPHTFQGGTIIDVGTPMTRMIRPAYDILEEEMSAHLSRHGAHPVQVPGRRLCVKASDLQPHYLPPDMTLHFQQQDGAKLHIKSHLLFVRETYNQRLHVCLVIKPDATRTVIGAGQQVDTRFTFDLEEHKLFFAPEECHGDA